MHEIKDKQLRKRIIENSQWPYGEREVQYQSVDPSLPGIRDMKHRYEVMNFPQSFTGKTVIDIGCNLGIVCMDAKRRGARRAVGFDYQREAIEVAVELAREYQLDVEFYTFDVNQGLDPLIELIGDEKFDYIFALSIWLHVDKYKLARIINYYARETCYFEGHACLGELGDTRARIEREFTPLLDFPNQAYLGETVDRKIRHNYVLWK